MKYLITVLIAIVCSLQARGQATVSVSDATVSVTDTLLLPVNVSLSGQTDVFGLRVKIEFDTTKFEYLGLESEGTISDSILTVSNQIDSELIMSFASVHPLASSGTVTFVALSPKEIGLTQVITKEVRINEEEILSLDEISNIIITDNLGNTPPFIIDIPDTLTFFTGQTLQLELDSLFYDVQDSFADLNIVIVVILQVSNEVEKPMEFALQQNYPNPFNPVTTIRFTLAKSSNVRLSVYNLQGQHVATLLNEKLSSGEHAATFDASQLSSGVYIYRIQAGEFMQTKKMMLIK